ncbi:hypothetical protein [Pectobacterium sp. B1J-3]|uniref:hypothetical protein n=1 Tax=Pectobacterium sp. B1J-3 TaxID=3385371 RepID=UPI003905C561
MKKDELVDALKERFPDFAETNDHDDVYLLYGSFGSFFLDVINFYILNTCEPRNYFYCKVECFYKDRKDLDKEIEKIFLFVDELYINANAETIDVLNTCIFEAMMGNVFCDELVKKYLSKAACHHYFKIAG